MAAMICVPWNPVPSPHCWTSSARQEGPRIWLRPALLRASLIHHGDTVVVDAFPEIPCAFVATLSCSVRRECDASIQLDAVAAAHFSVFSARHALPLLLRIHRVTDRNVIDARSVSVRLLPESQVNSTCGNGMRGLDSLTTHASLLMLLDDYSHPTATYLSSHSVAVSAGCDSAAAAAAATATSRRSTRSDAVAPPRATSAATGPFSPAKRSIGGMSDSVDTIASSPVITTTLSALLGGVLLAGTTPQLRPVRWFGTDRLVEIRVCDKAERMHSAAVSSIVQLHRAAAGAATQALGTDTAAAATSEPAASSASKCSTAATITCVDVYRIRSGVTHFSMEPPDTPSISRNGGIEKSEILHYMRRAGPTASAAAAPPAAASVHSRNELQLPGAPTTSVRDWGSWYRAAAASAPGNDLALRRIISLASVSLAPLHVRSSVPAPPHFASCVCELPPLQTTNSTLPAPQQKTGAMNASLVTTAQLQSHSATNVDGNGVPRSFVATNSSSALHSTPSSIATGCSSAAVPLFMRPGCGVPDSSSGAAVLPSLRPGCGVLLTGPPGCGKSQLATAIATHSGLPSYVITSASLYSGTLGASEAVISRLMASIAVRQCPCIVVLEDADVLLAAEPSARQSAHSPLVMRVQSALLRAMDAPTAMAQVEAPIASQAGVVRSTPASAAAAAPVSPVFWIGCATSSASLCAGALAPGRFECVISLAVPSPPQRWAMLKYTLRGIALDDTESSLAALDPPPAAGSYIQIEVNAPNPPLQAPPSPPVYTNATRVVATAAGDAAAHLEVSSALSDSGAAANFNLERHSLLLAHVARRTHGFSPADLSSLVREACMARIRRRAQVEVQPTRERSSATPTAQVEVCTPSAMDDDDAAPCLSGHDFRSALDSITSSARAQSIGTPPSPHATLSSLVGADDVVDAAVSAVLRPLENPAAWARLGVAPPCGLLLHGPSGTGKTVLAHAIANAACARGLANALVVRCPDIVTSAVGGSEAALAETFRQARRLSPCILVLDQFECLAPTRRYPRRRSSRTQVEDAGGSSSSGGGGGGRNSLGGDAGVDKFNFQSGSSLGSDAGGDTTASGADSDDGGVNNLVADRLLSVLLMEMDGLGSRRPPASTSRANRPPPPTSTSELDGQGGTNTASAELLDLLNSISKSSSVQQLASPVASAAPSSTSTTEITIARPLRGEYAPTSTSDINIARPLRVEDALAAIFSTTSFVNDEDADADVERLLGYVHSSGGSTGELIVIAITHDFRLLDPAVTRPGRLDTHVATRLPSREERAVVLEHFFKRSPLDFNFERVDTPVGATTSTSASPLANTHPNPFSNAPPSLDFDIETVFMRDATGTGPHFNLDDRGAAATTPGPTFNLDHGGRAAAPSLGAVCRSLAALSPGWSHADLEGLWRESAMMALRRQAWNDHAQVEVGDLPAAAAAAETGSAAMGISLRDIARALKLRTTQ